MLSAASSSPPWVDTPAAHRIPYEILDVIVQCSCALYATDVGPTRTPFRHICAVSRRWAELARPVFWESVDVTSAARLHALCRLLDTPPPPSLAPAARFIFWAQCSVDAVDRGAPWLHLVYTQLLRRIQHANDQGSLGIGVTVARDGVLTSIRTIHPLLPRTLPGCFAPVTNLSLSKIVFADRAATLRLLASLSGLLYLTCKDLSWSTDTLPPPSLVFPSQLRGINFSSTWDPWTDEEEGVLVWWLLPAAFGAGFCTGERALLRSADFKTVLGVLDAVQARRRLYNFRLEISAAEGLTHVCVSCTFIPRRIRGPPVSYGGPSLTFSYRTPPSADDDGQRAVETVKLTVAFSADTEFDGDTWTPSDWRAFVRHARGFAALREICMKFSERTAMQAFIGRFGRVLGEMDSFVRFECQDDQRVGVGGLQS